MKIFMTGGTGFIGSRLSDSLLQKGHLVVASGMSPVNGGLRHPNLKYISADTTKKGPWQQELKDIDAVVNLAGRSIFKRWDEKYKKSIYESRILTTRNLVEALPSGREIVLCSTSAAGYYGNRGDDILTESEPPGSDFLSVVCRDWEEEAFKANEKGVRVVAARFGVVLGKGGGALGKMIPAIRFFAGGPVGNGKQWFPWIHIEDLISAMLFVFDNKSVSGPLNFTAPGSARNMDLVKAIASILHRPSLMPAPAFLIRIILGEFGSSLLSSQRVMPEELLKHGFSFRYPDIKSAVSNILGI
ncbi:MAG: TIGR01777 family protein [Desulfobacteraceae bacterium]|nr:MAG: TIGR01777 family protein [Desulfobacteraceae bacterium]